LIVNSIAEIACEELDFQKDKQMNLYTHIKKSRLKLSVPYTGDKETFSWALVEKEKKKLTSKISSKFEIMSHIPTGFQIEFVSSL
jgi:hypothetical protein